MSDSLCILRDHVDWKRIAELGNFRKGGGDLWELLPHIFQLFTVTQGRVGVGQTSNGIFVARFCFIFLSWSLVGECHKFALANMSASPIVSYFFSNIILWCYIIWFCTQTIHRDDPKKYNIKKVFCIKMNKHFLIKSANYLKDIGKICGVIHHFWKDGCRVNLYSKKCWIFLKCKNIDFYSRRGIINPSFPDPDKVDLSRFFDALL